MARQLVFTSVPQGLTPGRTGFCTVARHGDLRERLVSLLESLSVYPADWRPAPVICSFRFVELAGARVSVLSRIVDAGFDYTHRTNFLAHHLVLDAEESLGAPPPAEIFLRWPGWLNRWEGQPRWLGEADVVSLAKLPALPTPLLPAATWQKLTGDAGHAAWLVEGTQAARRVLRGSAELDSAWLTLFGESSALLAGAETWRTEFTTCLQASDPTSAFRWAAVRAESAADTPAATRAGAVLLDLSHPETLPPVPDSPAARRARSAPVAATAPISLAPLKPIPLIKPTPTPSPQSPQRPSPTYPRPSIPVQSPPNYSWLVIIGGVLLALVVVIWMLTRSGGAPSTTPTPSPASVAPATTVSPPEPVQSATAVIADERLLREADQLAGDGRFLEALTSWQELTKTDSDFAQLHEDYLRSRLLPGAIQEWQGRLGQIVAQLNDGSADRAALATQLAALKDFPHAWPVVDPAALDRAWNSTAAMLNLLDRLPHDLVFVVDDLALSGAGDDYQDFFGSVNSPELAAILHAPQVTCQISTAPATSILPPPPEAWFTFTPQPEDFSRNTYLILHDASRGAAGGRYLQLLAGGPSGQIQIKWRVFNSDSDFFKSNPGNAPLRPVTPAMWLHFADHGGGPSFYLLLRRPTVSAKIARSAPTSAASDDALAWKAQPASFDWLNISGDPPRITLPAWLVKNLPWPNPASAAYQLVPAQPANITNANTFVPPGNHADTLKAVQYDAGRLVSDLRQHVQDEQSLLAFDQAQLDNLQKLTAGPPDERPPQATIDLARQTVEKRQAEIDQIQAAVNATAQPGWPRAAAPWTLLYGPDRAALPLLEFTPDETGPTP
jgi:hypothetical protein